MNQLRKRFLLFIFGCIGLRILFVIISKNIDKKYLPYLGYFALILGLGFLYIFFSGSRKTGIEVGGSKIWWNNLRPIHGILYLLFAYSAITKKNFAWIFLLVDVLIGISAFIFHHSNTILHSHL